MTLDVAALAAGVSTGLVAGLSALAVLWGIALFRRLVGDATSERG